MSSSLIAIVTETYRPEINGVSNTLGYWVDGLIDRNHQVQIIRPRQNSKDAGSATEQETQITTFGLPIPKYPELKFGLPSSGLFDKLWRKQRPKAVYVATEGPLGWSAMRVANKLGIPVISGFHTNFQSYSQFYGFGWLERIILRYLRHFHNQTDKTLTPTKTQSDYLVSKGFRNVEILSRGVDCTLFNPNKRCTALRAEWVVEQDELVCLYVGRLANEKNVSLISRSFKKLASENRNLRLVFVGDGPARASLEEELPDAIFAGTRRGDDLARHYASADIFLFPSRTDTFGNVVTEAMASGLGIVAFNDAAAREHLQDGESGYLANLSSEDDFTVKLERALSDTAMLRRIQAKSLSIAQSISWQTIVDQFISTLLSKTSTAERGKNHDRTENIHAC